MGRTLTPAEAEALAAEAHAGQTDKAGAPYIEHVRAVGRGLEHISERLAMVGYLHDIVEDTDWTLEGLREAGVPDDVVALVDTLTRRPGVSYEDMIRKIAQDPDAALVKIADNAHNTLQERTAALPEDERARLAEKYRAAREVLWPVVDRELLESVVERVNPALLR
ncbi:HD domain-containing protein [Streptomyces sp. URMC 123]|uniref:HD domain-containing protein n=1 Tax=Streptomyces sp. URMC 123 TaxID=3423403 RepID=UPI003F196FB5